MAQWADTISLITEMPPKETANANGFINSPTEKINTVFCSRRSVGQNEYYKSQQAGIKIEAKIEVHTVDYSGQTLAEFEGKRYSIEKTYEPKDSDIVELTLTDLKTSADREDYGKF